MNSKNKKITKINKKIIKNRRRLNNRISKLKRTINRVKKTNNRQMRVANINNFKRKFNILNQNGTSMTVSGTDLIYQIPDDINNQPNTPLITMIPANPAYWTGTRMSAISSGYQNYRPLQFSVTYVPQCAVTQQGNVLCGTIWGMTPTLNNLQQTLRTSNGGMLVQCYKKQTTNVKLGKNLQINLYRMGGKFDQQSNPFIFVAISIGTTNNNNNRINPGYFYVKYKYELKNPIGNTIKYYNSGLIKYGDGEQGYVNESLVYCSISSKINPGAIIQIDGGTATWNDDEVVINENDLVWYLSNTINSDPQYNLRVEYINQIDVNYTINSNATAYFLIDTGNGKILIYKYVNNAVTSGSISYQDISVEGNIYLISQQQAESILNKYEVDDYQTQSRQIIINSESNPIGLLVTRYVVGTTFVLDLDREG